MTMTSSERTPQQITPLERMRYILNIFVDRAMNAVSTRVDQSDHVKVEYVLERLENPMANSFPERSADVHALFSGLRKESLHFDESLKLRIIETCLPFIAEYDLADLDKRFYPRDGGPRFDYEQYVPVNSILLYSLRKNILALHVPPLFSILSKQDLLEKMREFKEGLGDLARILQSTDDAALQAIETIQGTSWLLKEYPRIAKYVGFEDLEYKEGSNNARGTLSKQRFIELHADTAHE